MVGKLSFSISLWMHDGGKPVDNLQVLIEVFKGCTIKILAIVGDDHLWQDELIDNGLLDEIASFLSNDPS